MLVEPLTEAHASTVCGWRNPPPYDCYDHPPYEDAAAAGWAIADPGRRAEQFRAVCTRGVLVGFSRLVERDGRLVLGVGMAPELTGQGRGPAFMGAVLADVAGRHPGRPGTLEVRTFNERAIRCYRRVGFVDAGSAVVEVLGEPVTMLTMVLTPPARP